MPRKKSSKTTESVASVKKVSGGGNGKKISVERINDIVDIIHTFSEEVHLEIYNMLKKYIPTTDFTSNNNGVYLNICSLSPYVLGELEKFVIFCKKNNEELVKREKECDEARKNLLKDNDVDDSDNDTDSDNDDDDSEKNKKKNGNSDNNIGGGAELSLVTNGKKGKKKKDDIKLHGATVSLYQAKSKFTGLQARIIKQHKVGNKGDFSGESGVGVNLETSSIKSTTTKSSDGGSAASTKKKGKAIVKGATVKTRRAAAKKNVKKLMK